MAAGEADEGFFFCFFVLYISVSSSRSQEVWIDWDGGREGGKGGTAV